MTPLLIEILLRSHCTPVPHERMHAPAVSDGYLELEADGLIYKDLNGIWRTTAAGAAHVSQLCTLAYPTQIWIGADGKPINVNG